MRAAQCWRLAVAAVLVVVSLPVAADPGGSRLATLGLEEGKAPSPEAVRELKQQRAERARRSRGVTPTVSGAAASIVDCSKGKSLQAAIDGANSGDVIEVRGLCHENVRIEGKALTLRGSDPALDGIRGVAPAPGVVVNGALAIAYADGARVESLSIESSPTAGVATFYSHVSMVNCRANANTLGGVHVSSNSFLDASGLEIANNGAAGLTARRGAAVFCTECELSGNAGFAANSNFGSVLTLLDSTVVGTNGISAQVGAYADLDCATVETSHPCSLDATQFAARAFDRSVAAMLGSEDFSGSLVAGDDSQVSLFESTQLSTGVTPAGQPRRNSAGDFSRLWVEASRIKGDTLLFDFGRGLLVGATIDGTLTCHDVADAFAREGLTLTPGSTVTGCEHIP